MATIKSCDRCEVSETGGQLISTISVTCDDNRATLETSDLCKTCLEAFEERFRQFMWDDDVE